MPLLIASTCAENTLICTHYKKVFLLDFLCGAENRKMGSYSHLLPTLFTEPCKIQNKIKAIPYCFFLKTFS